MTRVPRFAVSAVVVVAAAGVLAGCGSGLDAQTYEPRAAANSSDAQVGALTLRHVYVAAPDEAGYAAGAQADVVLSAATRADTDDRLVSATSDAAASVEVPDDLVVPSDGLVVDERITLVGLNRKLRSSDYVSLSLTFSSGTKVDMRVPVEVTDDHPAERPGYHVPETDSEGNPLPEREEAGSPVEDGEPTGDDTPNELGGVEGE